MSDRTYTTAILFSCAIVIAAFIWGLAEFTEGPRVAHPSGHAAEDSDVSSATTITGGKSEVPQAGEIAVVWTDNELPLRDPYSQLWNQAHATTVPLQVQDQAMPVLSKLTVPQVEVRALTNGLQIAWLVTWDDATADYHMDTDRFTDAVAIQFPVVANASYKMGDRDFPVQIMQWKALWQKDIDDKFQDVQDLHPNYWTDLYWFADGEFPQRVPDDFTRTEALDYFVAYSAGNPVAELYRKEPVQELLAEGFGTLSIQEESATVACGKWRDGRWSVVFGRPMATNDTSDYQFAPGKRDLVAFAVWEGTSHNVGARKQHSQWIVFEVRR